MPFWPKSIVNPPGDATRDCLFLRCRFRAAQAASEVEQSLPRGCGWSWSGTASALGRQLLQPGRGHQEEATDVDLEHLALDTILERVGALHGSPARSQWTGARVLVVLARRESRVLPHDPSAPHIVTLVERVLDDPMTGEQLHRSRTRVRDDDAVHEQEQRRLRV